MIQSESKAFTLVELLVVVAIIGVLASVVLASLNSARSKARDAIRMADMKTLVTDLEMYYNEYGDYPDERNDNCSGIVCDEWSTNQPFIEGIVNAGLMKTMKDPVNRYLYNVEGQMYIYSQGQSRCVQCPGSPKAVLRFYLENNIPTPQYYYVPGAVDGCTMSPGYVRNICLY